MYTIKKSQSLPTQLFGRAREHGMERKAELVPFVIMQEIWKRRHYISGPEIETGEMAFNG
jgi:hypothetical protein